MSRGCGAGCDKVALACLSATGPTGTSTAGAMAWYWHRAVPLIRAAGHQPIAVDLPGDDRYAGLAAYADIVTRAIAERSDVILVAL